MKSYWMDKNKAVEWFGTNDPEGKIILYKKDLTNNKTSKFMIPAQINYPDEVIYPSVLIGLNEHELLVGLSTGISNIPPKVALFRFNTKKLQFVPFIKKIHNYSNLTTNSFNFQDVYKDKDENLWFNTFSSLGMKPLKYNTKADRLYMINSSEEDFFLKITASRYNDFLWASNGKSIFKINVQTQKTEIFMRFDSTQYFTILCEDQNGNLIGRINIGGINKGMFLVDSKQKKLVYIPNMPHFTQAVADSNNNILGLIEDQKLVLYDTKNKQTRTYKESDGIKLELLPYLYKSDVNEISINDYYRIPIKSMYFKTEVPPLHLTYVKIAGIEFSFTKNLDTLRKLKLKHNQNDLSFGFQALNFLPEDANIYACMLQGLDTNWQQLGSSNAVSYANLSPGDYVFRVKTANREGIWGNERKLQIDIVPAFWQTTLFKLLIILSIVAFFYWLYSNRLNQLNLKNQLKIKEIEFQKRLADLTLSALRSQINPHFIFNCLNSIKLYATQNDIDAASDYLTKFSKLLRKVLDNSRNPTIPLADELEILQLYIEMEAMRFKDKLKYHIDVRDVDADYIEIPPMLLQPYVENAIWHGLMNKEGGGHLDVAAAMKNNTTLAITIKDDGVGRARAAELKSRMAVQHKSFGMEITSERLALINQINKTAASITIDDLTDNEGMAAGTLVTIQIEIP